MLTEPIDHEYKLHEYDRLCSELEKQLDRRDHIDDRVLQVAGFCATGAGIAATIGGIVNNLLIQVVGAAIALCACPILLAFLACQREQCDMRIGQLQWQIRYRHERPYLPGEGWDETRHNVFGKRPWFPSLYLLLHPGEVLPVYHELAARRGLSLIASVGMFLTIQSLYLLGAVLCSVLAFEHQSPILVCVFVYLLLAVAFAGIVLTCLVIQHTRHRQSDDRARPCSSTPTLDLGSRPAPTLLDQRTEYQDRVLMVVQLRLRLADGREVTRTVAQLASRVMIVPIRGDGMLLAIEEYNFGAQRWQLTLPGGKVEGDEDVAVRANMELRQEVGYHSASITPLIAWQSDPGVVTQTVHAFVAQNLTWSPLPGDPHEDVRVHPLSVAEALSSTRVDYLWDVEAAFALWVWVSEGKID